jgi:hypothetical protein
MTAEENVVPNETTEQEVPDPTAQERGIQQVPLVVQVREAAGVSKARDQLLQAIAREAQQVTDTQAGQASAALEQLARAFALVAAPASVLEPSAAGPGAVPSQTIRDRLHFWQGISVTDEAGEEVSS